MKVGASKLCQQFGQRQKPFQIGMKCVDHMLIQAEARSLLICNPGFYVIEAQLSFLFVEEHP